MAAETASARRRKREPRRRQRSTGKQKPQGKAIAGPASSGVTHGSRRGGRSPLQDGPCNLAGQRRARLLEFGARRGHLGRDLCLGRSHLVVRAVAGVAEQRGAFLEQAPAGGFLLGIDRGARLLQSVLVGAELFLRRGLARFRGAPGALGAGAAFGEHPLERAEKIRPQEKVEKKKDDDRRDSLQEQLAELVE